VYFDNSGKIKRNDIELLIEGHLFCSQCKDPLVPYSDQMETAMSECSSAICSTCTVLHSSSHLTAPFQLLDSCSSPLPPSTTTTRCSQTNHAPFCSHSPSLSLISPFSLFAYSHLFSHALSSLLTHLSVLTLVDLLSTLCCPQLDLTLYLALSLIDHSLTTPYWDDNQPYSH
jgi:hypothetical protein